MTIKEFLIEQLVNYFLWPEQAATIVDSLATHSDSLANIKWDDCIDGYPPQLLSSLIYIAKQQAIEYLEANQPQHIALKTLR